MIKRIKTKENKTEDYGKPVNNGNNREFFRRAINLSGNEVEILVKACTKYRHLLPAYIASKQEEIKTIDNLITKLSKANERI